MSQQKDNKEQTKQKLPEIQPREQNSQDEQKQAQFDQNTDNLEPLTHQKKKKRLLRRKVRKHSPEYYQEKKLVKLNRKKQKNWNSHFINDVIPEIVINNKNKLKRTLSRLGDKKLQIDKKNPISNKTLNIRKDSQTDVNKNKKTKSFNIRVVNPTQPHQNQNGESINKLNKEPEQNQNNKLNPKTQKAKNRKQSNIKPQDQLILNYKAQYQQKINQAFAQLKFLHCHKQALESFFPAINKKSTKELLDKQIIRIKQKKSQVFKITQSIEKRQIELQKIKSSAKELNDLGKISYQMVDNLRTATLACIQEILKWKQKWQSYYSQILQKEIIFDIVYKVENYLLTILKSGDELLSTQFSDKTNTQPLISQNAIKSQKNKNPKITNKDPFFISIFGIQKQSQEIILKIRACELLLLQEQYNSKKK